MVEKKKWLFRLTGVPPDQAIKHIGLDPSHTIKDAMPTIVWEYNISPFIPWRVIFQGRVLADDCTLGTIDMSSPPPPGVSRNALTIMFTGTFNVKVIYIVGSPEAGTEALQKRMEGVDSEYWGYTREHWGYADLDFQLTEIEHYKQIVSWIYDEEEANISRYYNKYKPDGIYAVYDCKNLESLAVLREKLIKVIQRWEKAIPVVIVGNNSGIPESLAVAQEEVDTFLETFGIPPSYHFQINSKTDDSPIESLKFLSRMCYETSPFEPGENYKKHFSG